MIRIERHDAERALAITPSPIEPLWLALFDHHVSTGAAGMATRQREGSWPQRRDHYVVTVAGSPHASLWLAATEQGPIGYALSFEDALDGAPVEVLESLALLPESRGHGLGAELVGVVEADARGRGIGRLAIDVMGGNDRALAFYHREGYEPYSKTWMRSVHPAPGAAAAAADLGDTSEAEAAFAEVGVTLTKTGHSDDTWLTAPSVAMLGLGAASPPADAAAFDAWLAVLLRGIELLAGAGYWTVWFEAAAGRADQLGEALAERGFNHGMSRVLKSL